MHTHSSIVRYQRHVARILWQGLPVPGNRWRPRPLPKPERNAPCHCGSGRKYKQCCAQFAGVPVPFESGDLYTLALAQAEPAMLEPDKLREVPPQALGLAAQSWNDAGKPEKTVAVLAPLFERIDGLDQRHEIAFDMLMDAYLTMGRETLRHALCERVAKSRDKDLATTARCRKVSMLADAGHESEAWALFEETRRLNPDNPQLWHLELTLLHVYGRLAEARMRSTVLAAKARKAGMQDLADALLQIGEHGPDMAGGPDTSDGPGGDDYEEDELDIEWKELCARTPGSVNAQACAALYTVRREEIDPGEPPVLGITPVRKLADLQRRWSRRFGASPGELAGLPGDADQLLDAMPQAGEFLDRNPNAWMSINVLDDLLAAAVFQCDDPQAPTSVVQASRKLADHATALLRILVGDAPARLEWGYLDSRPALRVLAQTIVIAQLAGDWPRVEELSAWGLELNPDDNHGWRMLLAPILLNRGDHAQALALADRYPDDLPFMACARVLALFGTGRATDAETALRALHSEYPRLMQWLLPDVVDAPAPDNGPGIAMGGDQEAWQHRLALRAAWVRAGAIEWARALNLKTPPPRKPPARKKSPKKAKGPALVEAGFKPSHEKHLRTAYGDYDRLHGFVTAVAWSPDVIMPSKWVQTLMSTRAIPAANISAMQKDMDAFMPLYNSLIGKLLEPQQAGAGPAAASAQPETPKGADPHAWAAGFLQGAELAPGGWRKAGRPLNSKSGSFGALYRLAARATGAPEGWRAMSDEGQPMLLGLQDEPSPDETLVLALCDLWSVVAPLRQARAGD